MIAIIAEILYHHTMKVRAIPEELRALIKGNKGCTDGLLIDQMPMGEAKDQRGTMSIAWIDYQKTFDSVPHRWLLKMLGSQEDL